MAERIAYSEFAYFRDNAEEFGLPWTGPPTVARADVDLGDGRHLSALVWGSGQPDLVLLHGGAQNAHTWDTVALALDRPLVAVDQPGHRHTDGGRNGPVDVDANADDVAAAIRALATTPVHLVGMSLGGATALTLTDRHPDLVKSLLLVDITPGVNEEKAATIHAFVNGPESFADFDEILARTIEFNPTRTEASLRRGILHNAVQREDGSWVWRYARFRAEDRLAAAAEDPPRPDFGAMWDALSRVAVPLCLARGMRPQSVVDDADEAELLRRQPAARIEHFAEAGHSIQGDQPVELAALIADFTGAA
jgi:pimeloyl-ACP methyl ester carboxylesterase